MPARTSTAKDNDKDVKADEGMVAITMPDDTVRYVKAIKHGVVCVHKHILEPQYFTVTHIATGLFVVPKLNTLEDAAKICAVITTRCNTTFSQKTKKLLLRGLPDWVYHWLLKCRKEQSCVDFIPFLKEYK